MTENLIVCTTCEQYLDLGKLIHRRPDLFGAEDMATWQPELERLIAFLADHTTYTSREPHTLLLTDLDYLFEHDYPQRWTAVNLEPPVTPQTGPPEPAATTEAHDAPKFICGGLAPFGYPAFPGPSCPRPAVYYIWPQSEPQYEPQIVGYGYCCAEHLAELTRRGHAIAQISEIATQRVVFSAPPQPG